MYIYFSVTVALITLSMKKKHYISLLLIFIITSSLIFSTALYRVSVAKSNDEMNNSIAKFLTNNTNSRTIYLIDQATAPTNVNIEKYVIFLPRLVRLVLLALQREPGVIEVCLRSEETDFQVDHFRAVCRFAARDETTVPRLLLSPLESEHLPLDPQNDLYGRILFHRGRFCRLRGYRLLKAKECVAEITADDGAVWFGPYLPAEFVLGNPAARDAALHAIQACIPHRRILPTGIERMVIRRDESGVRFVRAKERLRDGNNFVYDVEVTDARGEVIERWDGLRLRAVEAMAAREAWPDALLSPYLERRLEELADAGAPVKVALERGLREERPAGSDAVIQQALGKTARIWRRPDGKPVFPGEEDISAAHAHGFHAGGRQRRADGLRSGSSRRANGRRLARSVGRGEIQARGADGARTGGKRGRGVDAALDGDGVHEENRAADQNRRWCWNRTRRTAGRCCVPAPSSISTCVVAVRGMKSPLGVAVALKSRMENQPASAAAKNAG